MRTAILLLLVSTTLPAAFAPAAQAHTYCAIGDTACVCVPETSNLFHCHDLVSGQDDCLVGAGVTRSRPAGLVCYSVNGISTFATGRADFDSLGHAATVGKSYSNVANGATFSGTATTLCKPNYNYPGYPSTTGDCIAYDRSGSYKMLITFDSLVSGFKADFTGFHTPVLVEALAASGAPAVASKTCPTTYQQATPCSLSFGGPIVHAIAISSGGKPWAIDSVQWTGA